MYPPEKSTDEFYYVTLAPSLQTPGGNYVRLGPITYAVPVKFVEAQPVDYPSVMRSYVATTPDVSFPTMQGGLGGGYRLGFDVEVSTESVPQAQLVPVLEVNDDQSDQGRAA